jgi:hypothetical protein
VRLSPLVLGASSCESTAPTKQIAAAISMVGPAPMFTTDYGSRKVRRPAPSRLRAVPKPMPIPRISVGKTSAAVVNISVP